MKKVSKFWIILLGMGLLVWILGPPGNALAEDPTLDINFLSVDKKEVDSGSDLLPYTVDGGDGDPDTLSDDLNYHGGALINPVGQDSCPEGAESSVRDLLFRMAHWFWIF